MAACKVSEPDSNFDEVKEYMSLHYYPGEGDEFYLLWDEIDDKYFSNESLLCISKLKLGQINNYSAQENKVMADSTDNMK
jgi:hypothetical protein